MKTECNILKKIKNIILIYFQAKNIFKNFNIFFEKYNL